MLSGTDKKGRKIKKKSDSPDILQAVTGESDAVLVKDFFPTALKTYEILQAGNPEHIGLELMCGSLNVMYANVFIQMDADKMTDEHYDEKISEYKRARLHYLRGRDYLLNVLDKKHAGFKNAMLSNNDDAIANALDELEADDIEASYWCAAGALGAFSIDPLDPDMMGGFRGFVDMLEKAAELDPAYSEGAIWNVLAAFYFSAPPDLGGDRERAMECYNNALFASKGMSPAPYITYAESVCIPANDEAGFEENLNKALAINPDDNPKNRLATIIFQNKAKWLLSEQENYFIHW